LGRLRFGPGGDSQPNFGAVFFKAMNEPARKILHDLVDALPVERVDYARRLLERLNECPEDRTSREKRAIEVINANAEALNAEMKDVLSY
jgi:hypothetical protein